MNKAQQAYLVGLGVGGLVFGAMAYQAGQAAERRLAYREDRLRKLEREVFKDATPEHGYVGPPIRVVVVDQ